MASVSNITALAGRPKAGHGGIKLSMLKPLLQLLFLDCCRGSGASPGSVLLPAKSQQGGQPGPRQLQPPARPSKQDIFIGNRLSASVFLQATTLQGFSTVPGFVSFTASSGSPYLQVTP